MINEEGKFGDVIEIINGRFQSQKGYFIYEEFMIDRSKNGWYARIALQNDENIRMAVLVNIKNLKLTHKNNAPLLRQRITKQSNIYQQPIKFWVRND